MDVGLLKKCFQQRLEDVIIYLLQNCGCRTTVQISVNVILAIITRYRPQRGGADDMPPAYGSSTVAYRFAANQAVCVSPWIQKSRRIYVRPQTGPQSAHLRWPAVAKLQATSVPIA